MLETKGTLCSVYTHQTPTGPLTFVSTARGVRFVDFDAGEAQALRESSGEFVRQDETFFSVELQVREYFSGQRRDFNLPLDMRGTEFRMRVWGELVKIPYGETISYAQLAQRVLNPNGFRAVGNANGANHLPVLVPCHRVIRTGGDLGGYAGGLPFKRMLLELEGVRV